MLVAKPESELGGEPVFQKLGKVLSAKNFISAGSRLSIGDLTSKICVDTGIPVREKCTGHWSSGQKRY